MKHIYLLILAITFNSMVIAQDMNQIKNYSNISIEELGNIPHFETLADYNLSTFDEKSLDKIDKENAHLIKQYNIVVFLGVWCSDSKELVPAFVNYLNNIGVNKDNIYFYALDESKQSKDKLEKEMDVNFVPTFIWIDKETGIEKGRIAIN
jgi:thiol-disulfide isomerase/thioredoxin